MYYLLRIRRKVTIIEIFQILLKILLKKQILDPESGSLMRILIQGSNSTIEQYGFGSATLL